MNDPTEPYMVLRASNPHAAALVNLYAAMTAKDSPPLSAAHFDLANRMIDWRNAQPQALPTVAGLRTLAEALAALALTVGAVIRIETVPLKPLRQGNYTLGVQVYERHAPPPGHYPGETA